MREIGRGCEGEWLQDVRSRVRRVKVEASNSTRAMDPLKERTTRLTTWGEGEGGGVCVRVFV